MVDSYSIQKSQDKSFLYQYKSKMHYLIYKKTA